MTVQDEKQLTALYQMLGKESSPAKLDSKILAMAEANLSDRSDTQMNITNRPTFGRKWRWPLSGLVTVLLVSVIMVRQYFSPLQKIPPHMESAQPASPGFIQVPALIREQEPVESKRQRFSDVEAEAQSTGDVNLHEDMHANTAEIIQNAAQWRIQLQAIDKLLSDGKIEEARTALTKLVSQSPSVAAHLSDRHLQLLDRPR